MKRIALVIPALAIGLSLGACDDRTTPAEPASTGTPPAFDAVDGGGESLVAGSEVQEVHVTGGSDFTCVGTVTGEFDNIVVPPGTLCIVANAVVRGNIKALQDARLGVFNSQVGGSIFGDKADVLQLRNNRILGNIDIVEGGPDPVFLEVGLCGNELPTGNIKVIKMRGGVGISPFASCAPPSPNILRGGNMQIEENILDVPGRRLFVSQNQVAQNLQVYKNKGPFEKIIFNNTAGESVQCFDNEPPIVGGPNSTPKAEGQCF